MTGNTAKRPDGHSHWPIQCLPPALLLSTIPIHGNRLRASSPVLMYTAIPSGHCGLCGWRTYLLRAIAKYPRGFASFYCLGTWGRAVDGTVTRRTFCSSPPFWKHRWPRRNCRLCTCGVPRPIEQTRKLLDRESLASVAPFFLSFRWEGRCSQPPNLGFGVEPRTYLSSGSGAYAALPLLFGESVGSFSLSIPRKDDKNDGMDVYLLAAAGGRLPSGQQGSECRWIAIPSAAPPPLPSLRHAEPSNAGTPSHIHCLNLPQQEESWSCMLPRG